MTNRKSSEMTAATSNAAINATIKSLRSATKKVRDLIQTGIIQCIEHAKTFGDCTGAGRLVDAIPQEMRRAEVIKHFAEYSPIRVTPQGRGKPMKASLRKPDDAGYNDWNVEGIKANPWYNRDAIANADTRELEAFNIDAAEKRVIDIANLFERKATAKNVIEVGENGEETRKEVIVNDDRNKVRGLAMMLRMVGNDPWDAAQKLGLPTEYVNALKGVKPEESDTEDPAMVDTGDEARQAA